MLTLGTYKLERLVSLLDAVDLEDWSNLSVTSETREAQMTLTPSWGLWQE